MLHRKSFVKKTKRGKVLKVVREHYLRDDIHSGSFLDPGCPDASRILSADVARYLVLDTNIVLHQIDLLEHPEVQDAIVASTVVDEVKARNVSIYQRLRKLVGNKAKRFYVFSNEHHRETYVGKGEAGESANDRNDRAIRRVAVWYASQGWMRGTGIEVVLLSDDRVNRERFEADVGAAAMGGNRSTDRSSGGDAGEMGLATRVQAMGSMGYAKMREQEGLGALLDLVNSSRAMEEEFQDQGNSSGRRQERKRTKVYADHMSAVRISADIKAGKLHQGSLRVGRYSPFEGWVGSESISQDIYIRNRVDMNRAMDGDIVAVELLPESEWRAPNTRIGGADEGVDDDSSDVEALGSKTHVAMIDPDEEAVSVNMSSGSVRPTGMVVGIIRRNWRARGYCGSLLPPKEGMTYKDSHTMSVLVCPVEKKYPMVRIQTRQAQTLQDKRIVVAIDGWGTDSMYPEGHYVKTLGNIGDKDVETDVLILEHDINTAPFTPAVHACVPPLPWTVSEADLADPNRQDFRHLPICSVDPPGCKDIDDALHIRKLSSGNYELGVHIADVTHFLHPGSAMDAEASSRATTTYLVQRRIDMLPKPLTEDICSLRADVERLAFSVLWEITEDAQVLSTSFTKSVIKSRAALTYAEAQTRIDDERMQDELTCNLRAMLSISKLLRKARMDRGALELASPEVKFEIDTETQDPLDVGMYQLRETNRMVEEMMLLANCAVAERCLQSFPANSLLRRHPVPPARQFEPLLLAATAVGVHIDIDSSKALAESLDRAVRNDDPYFNKLIRIMATRCMTQARYFGSGDVARPEYYHYGLAAPLYTHFTSPIRRYADVVVHRVLMAVLGLEPLPNGLRDRDFMHHVVDNLNVRHKNAQLAGRASVDLHTLIFFKDKQVTADARVTRVKRNAIIVFVPKFGLEGSVMLSNEDDYVLDEEKQALTRRVDGSLMYTIFDMCAVSIRVEEGFGRRKSLVLELCDRSRLAASETQ
jgi:exosome complex exonuclease DIS3/RRP44